MTTAPDSRYEVRVSALTVVRRGDPIDSEGAVVVDLIADEHGGEYISITQSRDFGKREVIEIDPDEWPMVRQAVDRLFDDIRQRQTLAKETQP